MIMDFEIHNLTYECPGGTGLEQRIGRYLSLKTGFGGMNKKETTQWCKARYKLGHFSTYYRCSFPSIQCPN